MRAKLSEEADRDVEDEHGDNRHHVGDIARGCSDRRSDNEEDHQNASQLGEKYGPRRDRRGGTEDIWPMASQALRGLSLREPINA